jgi:hypothetical protein
VYGGEPNTMRLEHWSQKLADADAGARRRTRIHVTKIKQPIATVDDGNVQLLLCRPTEGWLCDGGEIGR